MRPGKQTVNPIDSIENKNQVGVLSAPHSACGSSVVEASQHVILHRSWFVC